MYFWVLSHEDTAWWRVKMCLPGLLDKWRNDHFIKKQCFHKATKASSEITELVRWMPLWQHRVSEDFNHCHHQIRWSIPSPESRWFCVLLWHMSTRRSSARPARWPESRTGGPTVKDIISSKPFVQVCRFTSSLLEVLIWLDVCELFASSVSHGEKDFTRIVCVTGKKSWEAETVGEWGHRGKGREEMIERKRN